MTVDRRRFARFLRPIVFLFIAFALAIQAARAVTLAWNPSPGANIAGYRVYYGAASRSYNNVVNAGNSTNVTINNLTAGVTYFFAATSYDTSGLESDYSTEISYTVPSSNPPPGFAGLTF